jgi:hypothetical protein
MFAWGHGRRLQVPLCALNLVLPWETVGVAELLSSAALCALQGEACRRKAVSPGRFATLLAASTYVTLRFRRGCADGTSA